MRSRRISVSIAALVAAVFAFMGALVLSAVAQDDDFIPSVSVRPADTNPDDPNQGQWFFLELAPGARGTVTALISNPADVDQTVSLYIRDLEFNDKGEPAVNFSEQLDVGLWGQALTPEVTIPARQSVRADFLIIAPEDAEPGDHVGVVVAEGDPQGGDVTITTRIATRLYVTIPGEAERGFEIVSVDIERDAWFWPRSALVTAQLRNTGRVRLQPQVVIKDETARGPSLLLSRSVEPYLADISIPWWGGLVRVPVEAQIPSGSVRRVNQNTFVIPWGLLVILGLVGATGWGTKRWWDARASRLSQLRADLRRIEALVTQRPVGPTEVEVPYDTEVDEFASIHAGLKQARRTQSWRAFAKMAESLHEVNGNALPELIEALAHADAKEIPELIGLIRSYPQDQLDSNAELAKLPSDILDEVLAEPDDDAGQDEAAPEPRSKKKKKKKRAKPKKSSKKTKKKGSAKSKAKKTSGKKPSRSKSRKPPTTHRPRNKKR